MTQQKPDKRRRWFTTKLPSQIDAGDIILFNSKSGKGPPLESRVLEPPQRSPKDMTRWIIKTERFPKGCYAAPTLRIPIKRDDADTSS